MLDDGTEWESPYVCGGLVHAPLLNQRFDCGRARELRDLW